MSRERQQRAGLRGKLAWAGPSKFSALYLWIGLMVLFALWVPDTFLTTTTLKIVLSEQAVTAIVAIGLTIALAAGALDLAFASALGICGMIAALLMAESGFGAAPAIAVALTCALAIGLGNAFLVAGLGISSIVATLGVSSILSGLIVALSGNVDVVGLSDGFVSLGTTTILGIALPVWIMLAVALVAWFVLEQTPVGRYVYATGLGQEVTRLSGLRTGWYVGGALVASAVLAGLAGVLATARVGAGNPALGPDYLLPAFAAAFLGSTQIKPKRFNVWGTVAAVYVLATGVQGLELAGAPTWLPAVFNGAALLIAVAFPAVRQRLVALSQSGRAPAPRSGRQQGVTDG